MNIRLKPNRIPTILNREGQGLTEYLVLLMLIAVISIVAVKSLGSTIKEKLQIARQKINAVSADE